jgi:hypothetical protein
MQSLPFECQAVAWVDCDVVFDDANWSEYARQALEQAPLIHLYTDIYNLQSDEKLDQRLCREQPATSYSIVHKMMIGEMRIADLIGGYQVPFRATCGQAWASRRDVVEKHGFYDACVLGSGDRGFMCAAWGNFPAATDYMRMNAARAEHFLAWARPYFATIGGRIGCIPGRIYHLWHGDLAKRCYAERHEHLEAFQFDPQRDIAIDSNGCWRWNSAKPEMHALVRQYFVCRDEDGAGEDAAAAIGRGAAAATSERK